MSLLVESEQLEPHEVTRAVLTVVVVELGLLVDAHHLLEDQPVAERVEVLAGAKLSDCLVVVAGVQRTTDSAFRDITDGVVVLTHGFCLLGLGSVPVRRGVFPLRVVLLEPGLDIVGRGAVLCLVVLTVLLARVGVLLGREDLGAAIGDELDDDALVGALVVHADAEATVGAEVGLAVVERGLVEDRCALASLVVHEVGPHAVARRHLLPARGERHVGKQRVARNRRTELDASLLENLAILLAHLGRQRVAAGERALAVGLLAQDGVSGTLRTLGSMHCDFGETVEVCGVARCGGHFYAFSTSLPWVVLT